MTALADVTDPEVTPGTPEFQAKVHEWTETHTDDCADNGCGEVPGSNFFDDLLAAIENGYLDPVLKQLGKAAKERFYEVNPRLKPAPMPIPHDFNVSSALILGENGGTIAPVERDYSAPAAKAGHFRAWGHMYRKSDFIGKFIRIRNYRANGGVPNDSICRIEAIHKTSFDFSVMWMPPDASPALRRNVERKTQAGETFPAKVEFHSRIFER